MSCEQLGMKCVNGRCVNIRHPGGQTKPPGGTNQSGPGIEIEPGGGIRIDPNQLRKFIK